ncbi:MAG TPA: terminase family protein, partial [Candidatus Sulfotelmatobacter sp.]|nr:terminase family protein [Candidatus Sulfotelmatobacter sp.]
MRFFSIFQPAPDSTGAPITSDRLPQLPRIASDPQPQSEAIRTYPNPTEPIRGENNFSPAAWFLPTQLAWLNDPHHLRIWEKSRQVGATKTDALDSVLKASPADARFDVWVTSRDEVQACLYLEDCKEWAQILHLAATDLGLQVLDPKHPHSAHVLQFANGRRIYCLSSNPNALAGKRGHVKIDEFALHPDQRLLYRIAKPVTQWGGTLSIISTHRGPNCLFNQLIRDIRLHGNPMGWHLYSYPIQKAVAEGLVARINLKSGRHESDDEFLQRTQAECIDKEQWDQEYCCIPSDDSTAFLTHEMISACEDPTLRLYTIEDLIVHLNSQRSTLNPQLYAGLDVARTTNLCVLDV